MLNLSLTKMLRLWTVSYSLFFVVLLGLTGCAQRDVVAPDFSSYRYVVVTDSGSAAVAELLPATFSTVGLQVVPKDTDFLSSVNAESKDTLAASISVSNGPINTAVALTLTDYLTNAVIWRATEEGQLFNRTGQAVNDLRQGMEKARATTNSEQAAFEHKRRHLATGTK